MAEKDIIQNLIYQLGQSQSDRLPQELDVHFADVDERTAEDLLLFSSRFAEFVRFYRNGPETPSGDWRPFFPEGRENVRKLLESASDDTPPHLALFLAFLEIYKFPQEVLNRITGRHLDFYYRDVLRLSPRPPVPDKAHVLIELKKNAAPVALGPEHRFSAGKDNRGVELVYAPKRATVVNRAQVDGLRSLFVDPRVRGTVRYAPVANSSDGLGGKLTGPEPSWPGFGIETLPPAEVGFAVASPVLRMEEGERTVTVSLQLSPVDSSKLSTEKLNSAFDVFVTGAKVWLGPYTVSPTLGAGGLFQFRFTVPESDGPVLDYSRAVHGYAYTAQAPVIQVLLRPDVTAVGYKDFKGVTVRRGSVTVEVRNLMGLVLESDDGPLDAQKAFAPFGPNPVTSSRFRVGCPEALAKKLSEIQLRVEWKGAPANFATHYSGYGVSGISNAGFTAAVSFRDGGSWNQASTGVPLFESTNGSSPRTLTFKAPSTSTPSVSSAGAKVHALQTAGSSWALQASRSLVAAKPVLAPFQDAKAEPRTGFITFQLEKDFLHATYRRKFIQDAMSYSKSGSGTPSILNEPYTPTVQSISLAYKAYSDEVSLDSASLDDFANPDLHFFHTAWFGQMREHRYQREQFGFLADKSVSLLPAYDHRGELLIGFRDLGGGDSVSVLFQVSEGSGDPDADRSQLQWSVLCDNYWKPLGGSEVVLDTTNGLLTSGNITFVIPPEATTTNTIVPAERIWIKAAAAADVRGISRIIEVAANAVEVEFLDQGNDPAHLQTPLSAGSIARLNNGPAVVKSVKQPYASFGGRLTESDEAFATRVSERLRHKNRCITPWDYERIVLEAFPQVHKVKCIPHARDGCWLAPGHVLLVVVPDIRNRNGVDPLQPRVDADTMDRIREVVRDRMPPQAKVHVKNPRYQRVQVDFKVRFRPGYEFNFTRRELDQALVRFLSPWAFDATRDITFGGKVYKSVLLDFVEDLDYVDYVTDFKMTSSTATAPNTQDINEAQPETPDAILVSAAAHVIGAAP